MLSLFYIAFLVSVSSLPIKLLPKRNVNQSFVGLKTFTYDYWLSANNVKSGDLEKDNFCGDGTLAMAKTPSAIAAITNMLQTAATGHRETWNGRFAWLGAKKWADSNTWSWLDGTPIGNYNWDTRSEPGSSGTAGSLSYQPFLGLIREGDHLGEWHDFHGQDQSTKGNNGNEASVGQLAVCQSRPQYWLTGAKKSTEMGHGDASVCTDGELAMPKTKVEQDRVCTYLQSLPKDTSTAWGGNYVWLGGYRPQGANQIWRWSDGGPTSGTPIPLTDKSNLMNHSNWDTNEPGHNEGGSGNSVQRFFGVKRDNGLWHDFHGNDQGNSGKEASVGFLALCQSTQPW